MGCVLGCFGSSKDRKSQKRNNKVLPGDQQRDENEELIQPAVSSNQVFTEKAINPVPELRDKAEEPLSFDSRKKVTFDLNVKTFEEVSIHELPDNSLVIDEEKEREKKEEGTEIGSHEISLSEDYYSINSSLGSYPLNHRYQNCRNSDDEDEEIEFEESDLEGEEEEDDTYYDLRASQEESSETFFSSSTHFFKISDTEEEFNSPVLPWDSPNHEQSTLGPNRIARDRSQYVHSVLNPVENLSQWKAIKASPTPLMKPQKENFSFEKEPHLFFSSEPSFNQNSNHSQASKEEMVVHTSLSNWLVLAENTPTIKTSSS